MAMTVSYSVVPRKNPAKKSEPAKYYAQAQASGELDFEELCEAITSRSTCTETDVRAAISGILYEVKRALTLLENHSIIRRIEGKFNQSGCKFSILPTVLAAVSSEKLNDVVSVLRKEGDTDEETEEDPAD